MAEYTFDFNGVENPSTTHVAKYAVDASADLPEPGVGGTEFSDTDYADIGADDASGADHETANVDGDYCWHQFMLQPSAAATADFRADIAITYIGYGRNGPIPSPSYHVDLYIYDFNAAAWLFVGHHSNSSAATISQSLGNWNRFYDGTYVYLLAHNPEPSAQSGTPTPPQELSVIITDYTSITLTNYPGGAQIF